MNEQDPLSQLRDIHLPATGGFWPPAPGWWMLLLIALLLAALVFIVVRRKWRRNRWLIAAKAELRQLQDSATPDSDWFAALNRLLKKSARQRYPQRMPESLSGEPWIRFLLETGCRDPETDRPIVEAMVSSTWQRSPGCSPAAAADFARRWLRSQKC